MELLLIRHGEPVRVEATGDGKPADPVLSGQGLEQAERLAAWLADDGLDALYVSPLRRAQETAVPIAAALGVEATTHPGLAEFDAGATSYIPLEELRRDRDPRLHAMVEGRWDELGISLEIQAFAEAAIETVEEIVARHPGQRVALVSHGGIINVYLGHLVSIPKRFWFEPTYTSVSRILAARGGQRSILSVNECGHLRVSRLAESP